jgi:HSP20 family protein
MTLLRYSKRPNDFFTNQLMNQLFRETQENFKSAVERDLNFRQGTNVIEEEDYFLLEMAIPGFAKSEVNIKVEEGHIKIAAKKEVTKEQKEKKYIRREFGVKSFDRSFKLSEGIDEAKISAEVIDGVLNVILPKMQKEEVKARSIEIK